MHNHDEFAAFNREVTSIFDGWCEESRDRLNGLDVGDHPKAFVTDLANGLLAAVGDARLLDPYAVFQRLMDYWDETLQDDAYLISDVGWDEAARLRPLVEASGPKDQSENILTVGKQRFRSDLVPASVIVQQYFAPERENLVALETKIDELMVRSADLVEEHGGEGGLLEEVVSDEGKISKQAIAARLKVIANDDDFADERAQIVTYSALMTEVGEAKAKHKQMFEDLSSKVVTTYRELSVEDIKVLVVEDKWLAHLRADFDDEVHRVSRLLATRLTTLATRYAHPISATMAETDVRWRRVRAHLERMGLTWQ